MPGGEGIDRRRKRVEHRAIASLCSATVLHALDAGLKRPGDVLPIRQRHAHGREEYG